MNATLVSRTLALIPDRVARVQSGALFDPQAPGATPHPERILHLAQFLNWLGPLREVTKEDLRILGLMTPYGKPAIEHALDEEGDVELEPEVALEAPLAVTAPLAPVVVSAEEPALT